MIRAGILQFAPAYLNREGSMRRVERLIEGQELPDLLVLPELADSGYNFPDRETAWNMAMPVHWNPFLDLLHDLAGLHNIFICTGILEKAGNNLFNTAVLLGPSGLIGLYRKAHLFMNERAVFTPGKASLRVWNTPLGKIGMQICFDWMFPELWRIMALKGCQLIAHPSNLVMPYAQRVIPSYSIINRIFIITANRCGHERELSFTGSSVISNPRGQILSEAGPEEEKYGLCSFNTDDADDKRINAKNHLFDDRRSDFYKEIL